MPKILANLDLNKNELQNARIQNLAAAPASPVKGQIYFDTITNELLIYDGTKWVTKANKDNAVLTTLARVVSPVTLAQGSSTVDVFRVESSDAQPLFQIKQNGDTVIAGVLTVNGTGTSTFAGDVVIGGHLTVHEGATVDATLTGENLLVEGNLEVWGSTTLGNNAAEDTTTINGFTLVRSPVTKAAGSSTVDVFRIESSDAQPLFQVKQNGDTIIAGVLTVNGTGTSYFAGDVQIGGHLIVNESATVDATLTGTDLTVEGNLVVKGNTTLGDNASQDTTTIKGFTKVQSPVPKASGSPTVDVFRVEDSDGAALFQVEQNGDVNIAGKLTVSGSGASSFSDNLTIAGNLTVQGSTTLGNGAEDTLTVNGTAILPANTSIGSVTSAQIDRLRTATSSNTANTLVLRDASGNFAANQITASKVTGLSAPTSDSDAATKAYVDATRTGLDFKDSVRAATTANITLSGLQTIDGVALQAGNRVLVKNQTNAAENGIYVVSSGAWTRASDADSSSEVTSGMYVYVSEGTVNGATGWVLTTPDPITLGTTALNFTQFSGAGSYVAGPGITREGNVFKIVSHDGTAGSVGKVVPTADGKLGVELGTGATQAAAGNHVHDSIYYRQTQLNSTTSGSSGASLVGVSAITGVTGSTVQAVLENLKSQIDGKEPTISILPVSKGGTGASTAAGARANLGATTKYVANVGDGTNTQFTITHNLGTRDVTVTVYETASPYGVVYPDIQMYDNNSIKLLFATAPTAGQYRVVIVG